MTINTYVTDVSKQLSAPSFLDFFGAEDRRSMRLRNVGNFVPLNITYLPKDLNLHTTAVITLYVARCNVLYIWNALV